MIPIRDLNPSRTTPWVSWSVILTCVIVFVYQVVQPPWLQREIVTAYALIPQNVTTALDQGTDPSVFATVLTSMFMHGGLLHIAGNLWFLKIFGDNVEDNFGHVRFAAFYVLCGVAAAGAQWAIDPYSNTPVVGASGAIAGVLAAYAVLYPRARVTTLVPLVVFFFFTELPALVLVAVWFLLQFFSGVASLGVRGGVQGGVAHWAHIGGFVAGLLLTFVMRRPAPPPAYDDRDGSMPARRWR
jgi:membrane associated rhomboid family serine protease